MQTVSQWMWQDHFVLVHPWYAPKTSLCMNGFSAKSNPLSHSRYHQLKCSKNRLTVSFVRNDLCKIPFIFPHTHTHTQNEKIEDKNGGFWSLQNYGFVWLNSLKMRSIAIWRLARNRQLEYRWLFQSKLLPIIRWVSMEFIFMNLNIRHIKYAPLRPWAIALQYGRNRVEYWWESQTKGR